MTTRDPPLTDLCSHFSFGENWASYARLIDEAAIAEAERGLVRLFGENGIHGRTFLDLGCGSGLHALAALRLGATRVTAIDIDPVAVKTAQAVLTRFQPSQNWTAVCRSVLELAPADVEEHDIVYSWGVLHHTGAMREAIRRAAACTKVSGLLAVALYRRSPLCPAWRAIKRWYSRASSTQQLAARKVYISLFGFALKVRGRNLDTYIRSYKNHRGMDFHHDVHDWLGGYPYESIAPKELNAYLAELGFDSARCFTRPAVAFGLFGSHCDEYVFSKNGPRTVVAS